MVQCAKCGHKTVRPKRVQFADGRWGLVCQGCFSKMKEAEETKVGSEIPVAHPGPPTSEERLKALEGLVEEMQKNLAWIQGQLATILTQRGIPIPDWLQVESTKSGR